MKWERKSGTEQRAEARARVRVLHTGSTFDRGHKKFKRALYESAGTTKVRRAMRSVAWREN